jgi:hypothetical protein
VAGPKCAPPAVAITSWNGGSLSVRVTSATRDAVALSAAFVQTVTAGERTTTREAARQATLSGGTTYTRVFTVRFPAPSCGFVDTRRVTVRVTSDLGTATDSARFVRQGRACPEPEPEPTEQPTEEPTKEPTKEPPSPEPTRDPGDDGPVLTLKLKLTL